ncbi:MAG: GNAT family N-acetyltransferase [Bulleidia sp.]
MNIRTAETSDLQGIYSLVCQLEETESDFDVFTKVFFHVMQENIILVCTQNDVIAGYLVLALTWQMHHNGKTAEIVELCIHEDYRNQALGSALLQYAQQIAEKEHCVNIDIRTNRKRKDAHRFYERHGFSKTHYNYTKALS